MQVPLVDLKAQYAGLKGEIDAAIARVVDKGNFVSGEEVERFEQTWAKLRGAKFCIGVSSGTDAIYLAAYALRRVERTAEFAFAPAFTFIGSIEPLVRAGFRVKLVDVNKATALVDVNNLTGYNPRSLKKACLLLVHLYGAQCTWGKWLAERLHIIEDAAQCHSIMLKGRVAAFSFYPTKSLGAYGQAGAVVTNDPMIFGIVKSMRNHGETPGQRFTHQYVSGNYRMDELQAAVLNAKLPYLDTWRTRRGLIARYYMDHLPEGMRATAQPITEGHDHHIFAFRIPDRNKFVAYLAEHRIQAGVRYPVTISEQPGYVVLPEYGQLFPNAKLWADTGVNLPIYAEMTDSQVEYVAGVVKKWS